MTLADTIRATLISQNEHDQNLDPANMVDGLFEIARAINRVADALNRLGNGDAATSMGAIEAFGMHIGEKLDTLADAVRRED